MRFAEVLEYKTSYERVLSELAGPYLGNSTRMAIVT